MKTRLVAGVFLAVLLIASAGAQTRKTQEQDLERFEKYAGAAIDEFDFWSLYKWKLVGPEKVVVWSTINDAYLITVDQPCPGLEWTKAIGVTSQQKRIVSRKFDYVTYGKGQRCHINEIRPIDYKQMLKDGEDARK
jgi:type II secretory pathway pseudopilin PulG